MKQKTINQSIFGPRQKIRWSIVTILTSITLALCNSAQAEDIEDHDITRAIEDEYLMDTSVPYNDIDVWTLNGIVSLEGVVDNLLAKKRAGLIAETVKGVRSISNRLIVKPSTDMLPSDLKKQVSDAMQYDAVTESFEIDVTVDSKGIATLEGKVDSWKEKQLQPES